MFWNSDTVGLNPASYSIAIHLFVRLLGAIYIIAYLPFLCQMRGLFGKDGIQPIARYLNTMKKRFDSKRFYYIPTLFWLNASDTALLALIWSGIVLGILLLLGVYSSFLLLLLYLIHLSLTSAGQDFLSFGWETFLMELTLSTLILISTVPLNMFGWISFNFLLFRFHLQAGASKILSGDKNWRNLTAISYHYLTQPLPNTIAWYFHKLPLQFHRCSTLAMFYVELIVPLAIFAPPEMRLIAFVQFVGLQLSIWLTGNLSYLNHMTISSCIILLHNRFLEPFFDLPIPETTSSFSWNIMISSLGAIFLALQVISLWTTFFPGKYLQSILRWSHPFHLAYPHGIFAVMTTKRYEVIIEGSQDGHCWQEYLFYYKPGDLAWRPRRISPYQPRIDWQAWFLPFGSFEHQWWFQEFLIKLLEGSPAVTKLLKYNPFVEKSPRLIRALIYDYEFTTWQEKAQTGRWWKRRFIGEYAPPIELKKIPHKTCSNF